MHYWVNGGRRDGGDERIEKVAKNDADRFVVVERCYCVTRDLCDVEGGVRFSSAKEMIVYETCNLKKRHYKNQILVRRTKIIMFKVIHERDVKR